MSLLQVEGLQAGYGKKTILRDITLEVSKGQLVGILGPNGCGKSTLIKALCKSLPFQGKVSIDGKDIGGLSEKQLARYCAYVPQRSGLSIDISVLDVVLMGFYPYLGLLERPDKKMQEKAQNMLSLVGFEEDPLTNYMELSEGQKRLCILARSLVAETPLLLLDEPDASLDFGIRNRLFQIMRRRAREQKSGLLLSLHDTNLALSYCDKIYLMKDGQIIDQISPNEDLPEEMERKLSVLYGKVKVLTYTDEKGINSKVMVQA